jgi:putative DNA methylase
MSQPMPDTRLIERWLPIAQIGEESVRERRSMTALPPTYYLHVWWARRPLVASRAAILASLLPANADREKFMHLLGIHGDPVKTRARIDVAKKTGEDLGSSPYGYQRAFKYVPTSEELRWLKSQLSDNNALINVLDPTAGGGSIPFEAVRLGLSTLSNDLNPVAALLQKATFEYPAKFGGELLAAFEELSGNFLKRISSKLDGVLPDEPKGTQILGYLWARTIRCPYCEGLVPLSPAWRLAPNGTSIRLIPHCETDTTKRCCEFEVVNKSVEQSLGTIADGDAKCPFPDCGRVIDGDEVKRQAQTRQMGEQLYAVAFKHRVVALSKSGKSREKWERSYRAPGPQDDNSAVISARLAEKLVEWEALGTIPTEDIGNISNYDRGHKLYGMTKWADFFSPRQLLTLGLCVEAFSEVALPLKSLSPSKSAKAAALIYLAISIDKFVNFSCRQTRWGDNLERIVAKFDQHNFSMKWCMRKCQVVDPVKGSHG